VTASGSLAVLPVALPSTEFEVTMQRIEDYVQAIGDENPRYRRVGRDASAAAMPPGFAAAFMQGPVRRLFDDDKALAELGIDGNRVVFGEVTYTYHDKVRPGDWVSVDGALVGRAVKGTREVLTFETCASTDRCANAVSAQIVFVRL
jgi:hypothetical protein